ncbi:MAG: DRTGG domain-containing protein [Marinifilaceae bacterium]|nr:DRTGG domain-containing protein [Marinifilaceae bacterium]
MKVQDLITRLGLTVHSGKEGLEREVTGGYTSDLLSDVMGHAKEGDAWVTLQTHKNIMAIASLKDLAAIIVVKGHVPEEDTTAESEKEGIPILTTREETFEITGRLYELLKSEQIV